MLIQWHRVACNVLFFFHVHYRVSDHVHILLFKYCSTQYILWMDRPHERHDVSFSSRGTKLSSNYHIASQITTMYIVI